MKTHLDVATWATLLVTLILFVVALLVKGFGHDLSLEAAVLLVSLKLVVMTYKASATATMLVSRLDMLKVDLNRIEQAVRDGYDPKRSA